MVATGHGFLEYTDSPSEEGREGQEMANGRSNFDP